MFNMLLDNKKVQQENFNLNNITKIGLRSTVRQKLLEFSQYKIIK